MRIIDKQHDFYDYLQDPTDRIVFGRRGSFLLTKEEFCVGLRYQRYHGDSHHRFVLLQCGATHWLFLVTITAMDSCEFPIDYNVELLLNWKNYERPNKLIDLHTVSFGISMWDYMIHDIKPEKVRIRVNDLKAAIDQGNYREEHNLGCHTRSKDHKGTFIHEIQDIPILKACGIAELVDPVSVFCAIEEHFSMEKTASETTEAKGTTEKDRIIMHGFDAKTSFRKMDRG